MATKKQEEGPRKRAVLAYVELADGQAFMVCNLHMPSIRKGRARVTRGVLSRSACLFCTVVREAPRRMRSPCMPPQPGTLEADWYEVQLLDCGTWGILARFDDAARLDDNLLPSRIIADCAQPEDALLLAGAMNVAHARSRRVVTAANLNAEMVDCCRAEWTAGLQSREGK